MQRWLAIEEYDVAVLEVSLDNVADAEVGRSLAQHGGRHATQRPLAATGRLNVVGARVVVGTREHELLHALNVVARHALGIRERLGHELRHRHLVDAEVRVGADHRAAGEVDALAREIAAKATLLALESLAQRSHGLGAWFLGGDAGQVAVDKGRTLHLQMLPQLPSSLENERVSVAHTRTRTRTHVPP